MIVKMYVTKNPDHNNGLEDDLINTREQNRKRNRDQNIDRSNDCDQTF